MLTWILSIAPGLIYFLLAWAYLSGLYYRRQRAISLARRAGSKYKKSYQIADPNKTEDWYKLVELRKFPYVFPLSLTFLFATGLTVVSLMKANTEMGLGSLKFLVQQVPLGAIAGFWGAYVWGIYDCLTRFRTRTWTANSQYFIWLRLMVGPALGALVGLPLKDSYSPLIAFGLGAFPAETLRNWLQGQVGQKLKIVSQPEVAIRPAWSTIQGLTQETIDRLREADVPSPCQLANSEPVGLNSRTSVEWKPLLDLIDQALLAIYVEEKIDRFRSLGI